MKKAMMYSLWSCGLILVTVLVHKLIYRAMFWDYESLLRYWGLFVAIFFALQMYTYVAMRTFKGNQ